MAPDPKSCTNAECRASVDGKCVEGYSLEECPHILRISVDEIEESTEAPVARELPQLMDLSLGDTLNRTDASSLQRRRLSRVVGIIGPNNAGKTSLLASVYDLLQEGQVAGIAFAGSATLIGFEKVCHDARVASRRDAPHTERTSAGVEATFFHLDLRPADAEIISLFVSDRSGEDYLAAADEISRADEFFELRRADVVALLINGEHLVSYEHRHEAAAATSQIVDALVEAAVLRSGCRLAIVLTKQDSVVQSPHAARAQRTFDSIVDAIIQDHGAHFGEIERFIIAASPKETAVVKRGEGVDKLLLFWLRSNPTRSLVSRTAPTSTRMIDLLDCRGEGAA